MILHAGVVEGGTELTLLACERIRRPHVLVDCSVNSAAEAAALLARFVREHGIECLNVAGPRESKWAGARDCAYRVISGALAELTSSS